MFNQPMDIMYNARVPWRAVIEVTNACQLNCIHCFHDNDKKNKNELSKEEIFELILCLKQAGTMQLTITGGEATLRPDIIEIIEFAIACDMKVQLLSNGQIDNVMLQRLTMFKRRFSIEISLLGFKENNDAIVKKEGAYDRAINAIQYLNNSEINVTVNTVVMKQNYTQLRILMKTLSNIGVEWSHSPLIFGDSKHFFRLNDAQLCSYYRMFPDETRLMFNLNRINLNDVNFDIGCNAGCTTVLIAANGDVFPCIWIRKRIGNIREKTFGDIWINCKTITDDFGCYECLQCKYYAICKRCPAYAFTDSGSYSERPKEWCRQMKAQCKALECK